MLWPRRHSAAAAAIQLMWIVHLVATKRIIIEFRFFHEPMKNVVPLIYILNLMALNLEFSVRR